MEKSSAAPKIFRSLQDHRRSLLETIWRTDPLIIGTFCTVLRRCGNPYCHCAKKPAHKQNILLSMEKGKRRCRFVRQKDAGWVREAWERYRECKRALKEIRAIHLREAKILLAQIQKRGQIYKN
jgi:hypothetical protein